MKKVLGSLALTLALGACGGGGSEGQAAPTAAPVAAPVTDAPAPPTTVKAAGRWTVAQTCAYVKAHPGDHSPATVKTLREKAAPEFAGPYERVYAGDLSAAYALLAVCPQ